MKRFAENLFVVNKVILNLYMCFTSCIAIFSNLCVIYVECLKLKNIIICDILIMHPMISCRQRSL